MNKSDIFREDIRILLRQLGILDKVSHTKNEELTLPQCHALVEIGRSTSISLRELATILNIDVSTTSRTVDGLVKKNYVLRKSSDIDRRSIDISLSKTGYILYNKIEDTMTNHYRDVFDNIPIDKQDQVLDSLQLMLSALQINHHQSD